MLVQERAVPKHRSTHISDYQSTKRESYECDENQLDDNSHVSSGALVSYKNLSRLVLCYKKDWDTLMHHIYFHCLLPVTNYLLTKLFVTYNFSACREYLTENRLSFPSAPCWVRHSYLSKGLRQIPYTCGSSRLFSGAVAGECSAFGKEKFIYSVLEFSITSYYGK